MRKTQDMFINNFILLPKIHIKLKVGKEYPFTTNNEWIKTQNVKTGNFEVRKCERHKICL